jgi:hypothetical protein
MKTAITFSLSLSLVLGVLSLGSVALANGPKTPVDAFNRIQGKQRRLRRPVVSGTKLLLQMSSTPGAKGKTAKTHKTPSTKVKPGATGSLLRTPGTSQLLRSHKVSQQSWRDAAKRMGGTHTVTTASSKKGVETKPASGFFSRVFTRLSDLIADL